MLYAAECVKWMKAELDAGRAIDIIYTHVRGTVLLSMCRELAEARGYLWCILSTSLKAMQALCKKINKNNNGVTQSDLTQAHFLSFL
jgi:hypothetical protein